MTSLHWQESSSRPTGNRHPTPLLGFIIGLIAGTAFSMVVVGIVIGLAMANG